MAITRFPIRIGARSRLFVRLWTARPETSFVELDDAPGGLLSIRFGRFRFQTPIENLASWRIEGPFIWVKAIGVRRSVRGGDVSFAGSAHGGVRIDLKRPVKAGILKIPAIYAGVDDLEGLAAALTALGITGTDARARLVR